MASKSGRMATTALFPSRPSPLLRIFCMLLVLCISSSRSPLALAAGYNVTHLPGLDGPLPFRLETGYVEVDDTGDAQMFYYFTPSERDPAKDPLMLWFSGGPGCSSLQGMAFEFGPVDIRKVKYDGSIPTLVLNPYSWTKVASIIFVDSPIGTGFSFSRTSKVYEVGDASASKQLVTFMKKWLIDHPEFISNPFYIGGDSYSGKVVPLVAHTISEDTKPSDEPLVNLKGYLIGNPFTGDRVDEFSKIPFAYNMGIISDELYESTIKYCEGQDYNYPTTIQCTKKLDIVKSFLSEIEVSFILDPRCPFASPHPKGIKGSKSLIQMYARGILIPPQPIPEVICREYRYYLAYYWTNNYLTREALHIQKGTIDEWQRCNRDLPYAHDVKNVVMHHLNLTRRGYRALVYSGDHDAMIPFIGTKLWIESLNLSITDDWRSWSVNGQVAGYTRSYLNNLTFATIKGAGHTAPEYRPKECLAMFKRWMAHKPL